LSTPLEFEPTLMKGCFMKTIVHHTVARIPNHGREAAHLMITQADLRAMAREQERFMAEINLRATHVGPILEGILNEVEKCTGWDWE
jgi:hypothetical protein